LAWAFLSKNRIRNSNEAVSVVHARPPISPADQREGDGVINIHETIDASVFGRWRTDASDHPLGSNAWAKRRKVDTGKITISVRADDPSVVVWG
jgi:hypothetical protein